MAKQRFQKTGAPAKGAKPVKKALWGMRRWGHTCLFLAVVINSAALFSNLKLSDLRSEYQENWEKEQYFIANTTSISAVVSSRQILHSHLNTLKLLRRIGADIIEEKERQQLILDERTLERQTTSSLRASVIAKYLLTNDPPMEIDLDSMFARFTDDQLLELAPKYDEAAYTDIKDVKLRMIAVRESISVIQVIHTSALLLSTILVIVGSSLLFALGQPPEIH